MEFDEDPGGGGDDLVGEGDSGGDDDHGNTFPRLHRKLKTNENMCINWTHMKFNDANTSW